MGSGGLKSKKKKTVQMHFQVASRVISKFLSLSLLLVPENIRHKVFFCAQTDVPLIAEWLQGTAHALFLIVDARRLTIAIHVGKQQLLGLLELCHADLQGRRQYKPRHWVTRRFRQTTIVSE